MTKISTMAEQTKKRKAKPVYQQTALGKSLLELYAKDPEACAIKTYHYVMKTPRAAVRASQTAILDRSSRSFVTVQDIKIRVYIWEPVAKTQDPSDTTPVVLISHGFGSSIALMTEFVEPLLQNDIKVVAFDHAAHGESEGDAISIQHMVETTKTMLHTYRDNLLGFLGFSFGASAALMALAELRTDPAPSMKVTKLPENENNNNKKNQLLVAIAPPTQSVTVLGGFLMGNGCPELTGSLYPLLQEYCKREAIMMPEDIWPLVKKLDHTRLDGWDVLMFQDRGDKVAKPGETTSLVKVLEEGRRRRQMQVRGMEMGSVDLGYTTGLGHFGMLADASVVRKVCEAFGVKKERDSVRAAKI